MKLFFVFLLCVLILFESKCKVHNFRFLLYYKIYILTVTKCYKCLFIQNIIFKKLLMIKYSIIFLEKINIKFHLDNYV